MDAAAARLDFEEARRLRDRIALIRAGSHAAEVADVDTSGLMRQQPGDMGIGSNRARVAPPEGWTAPPKPDLKTRKR